MDNSLTRFNVISSRIRLARNVQGISFPRAHDDVEKRLLLPEIIEKVLRGAFDYEFFYVRNLSDMQKMALVERHFISPALVKNSLEGAAIVEKSGGISIMINEEDHLREQCFVDGFNLKNAYQRLRGIDDIILGNLPIIFDRDYGFITACPTNTGAGMRASTMLFLPALRLVGAIEDTIKVFTKEYGLTIRGVYGEGSAALGDAYQLSNTGSLIRDENEIVENVELATLALCKAESIAREKLKKERKIEIQDKVSRSFATLESAYMLSSDELLALISDTKLGISLDMLPFKDTRPLDKLYTLLSAASLTIRIGECTATERDIMRAKFVREILQEVI